MQNYEETRREPLYRALYTKLRQDIESGRLPANAKLLSKRKMAEREGVSVSTVEGAYAQLLCEGFIISRPKSGFFVCELETLYPAAQRAPERAARQPEHASCDVDFAITGVDRAGFPYSTWRRLMKNAFDEYDENLLARSPVQGELALRRELVNYLYMSRGVHCTEEQIVVGAGTDNLLQILSYILDDRCKIAMEDPVYHESYLFFRRMGHEVLMIPIDRQGMPVEPLCAYENLAAYITPAHQFPLGVTMPITRRIGLINWANGAPGRYLIEDDYDSEFRYNAKPYPALKSIDQNGRVIYLGSFSRAISPALRISYMVLPRELMARYRESCSAFGSSVSKLDQLVLAQFLNRRHFETHLNKMRKIYRQKRAALDAALCKAFGEKVEIHGENAGQHLLVRHCGGMSEAEMCAAAERCGVRVYPISPYFVGRMPARYQSTVLLGYATLEIAQIREGIARLRTVW